MAPGEGLGGLVHWCRMGSVPWFPALVVCCAVKTSSGAPLARHVVLFGFTSLVWGGSCVLLVLDIVECRGGGAAGIYDVEEQIRGWMGAGCDSSRGGFFFNSCWLLCGSCFGLLIVGHLAPFTDGLGCSILPTKCLFGLVDGSFARGQGRQAMSKGGGTMYRLFSFY